MALSAGCPLGRGVKHKNNRRMPRPVKLLVAPGRTTIHETAQKETKVKKCYSPEGKECREEIQRARVNPVTGFDLESSRGTKGGRGSSQHSGR